MIDLIEKNYETLKKLCVQYKVKRLEIFGSAVRSEDFDPEKSDLDFLVEFEQLQSGEYADSYFGLLEAIENLFNRHIDLVMTKAIKNPYFMESINQQRKLLYAA